MSNSGVPRGDTADSPWVKADAHFWERYFPLAEKRVYEPGSTIYVQGDRANAMFYCLHKGRVKVYMLHRDGTEKILSMHEPPSLFGESSAFDGHPYFASASALEKSEVYVFSVDLLCRLIVEERDPLILTVLAQSIVRKLRLLALQVYDLSFLEAKGRIAHLLSKLAADYGVNTPTGVKLTLKTTHQELADISGTARVTVTRVLNELKEQGIISTSGRYIIIRDMTRLYELWTRFDQPQAFSRRLMREESVGLSD